MRKFSILSQSSFNATSTAVAFMTRRGLFSVTRIALPCRNDEADAEYEREKWSNLCNERDDLDVKNAQLTMNNSKLEKELCIARSIMVKMHLLLKKAVRTKDLKIPVALANAIADQMEEQRKHRLEDHKAEIKAAENDLASIRAEQKTFSSDYLVSDNYRAITAHRKAEIEKLLRELKAIDTNSDAFLDRDAVPHYIKF